MTSWRAKLRGAAGLLASLLACLLSAGCRHARENPFSGTASLDVVLITIDTLRADALGFAGNSRVQTPNLDRLAREGVIFSNAHAHNVMTLPSHVNIFTGRYPFEHGVRDNEGFKLPATIPTLATLLKSKGYATGAFIGAFPLDARFGLDRGFDVYDQHYPQGANQYDFVVPERPAPEVIGAARQWFAGIERGPRFLWVHLYDSHFPYRPPPPFDRQYAGEPYLGEVALVDSALGPLISDLSGKTTPTLLALTGDHGEALGEHGETTHGLFAYEATLRVPLLLWSPGHLQPRSDPGMARHIDLVPTILEAVKVAGPKDLPGVSLLHPRTDPDEVSYFESLSTCLTRGWAPLRGEIGRGSKFIDLPVPELYDLRIDPAERNNLVSEKGDTVRFLKKMLPLKAINVSPSVPSSEEVGRLRSLGYLTGRSSKKERFGLEDDPKNLVAVNAQIEQMVGLYQSGSLPESIVLAKQIVQEQPDMQLGYEYLSFLQGQRGDDPAASATLQEAGRRDLLDDRLKSRLGLLYVEMGRPREALEVLEPLSESRNPDVLNALGIARAGAGKVPEALQAFQRVLEVDPRNAVAYQNIGITYLRRGETQAALKAFDQAFMINDRVPRAWNGRGVALEATGRHEEALQAWKRAVELDPGQLDALFNIGIVAGQRGDGKTATWALERFVALAPAATSRTDIVRARKMLAQLRASD